MPELPEIETIKRDLIRIEGLKVAFNQVFNDVVFKTDFYKLDGLFIDRIERYGKYLIIKFEKSALLIHLGMSGQLFLDSGETILPKHCHWLIQLSNREQLRYVDTRRFGKIWHMSYKECRDYVETKLGPEPFDITGESFILRIRDNKYLNREIKAVLLEQKLIAGIGNIYASEICYEAFIHPKTLVKNLTDNHLINLHMCINRVLNKAIKNQGTTISDYRTGKGKKGNNQTFLKAYKQKECKRCNGKEITKEKLEKRMTYFCNECQRLIGG
jgi:formamidopyrimidine-DNA glycosylase